MRSVDEDFHQLVTKRTRDEAASEQLRHAARVLATSPGSITAITCIRRTRAGQAAELSALARWLASTYDLTVEIDCADSIAIRFTRPHSLTSR